jgi:hypothetical protein|tara:strand:- start:4544 stop:6430 length:1887 start_codon:yes stop_codon:yes gene_type:complete
MATTIQSTALDFNSIKNNLKTFLSAQDEFADYNFEASGLSNILDVLAYNTHYNALIANFALNESFLGTAQLRSSVVSLATAIGYVPDSRIGSRATVNLSITIPSTDTRPELVTIPKNTKFTSAIDDITYTFQNREELTASNSSGLYSFQTVAGDSNVQIFEGTQRTKTFIVGPYEENITYVIPDANMDITTAIVSVYDSPSSSNATTYTNITSSQSLNSSSTVYILKEAPNGFFELTFGDGNTLGATPTSGMQIVLDYLSVNGPNSNGATTFTPVNTLSVGASSYTISATTSANSTSGKIKETIESIRKNAPFLYASQNRMITASDYSALILRNFSTLIDDINAWGGEENAEPKFGSTYVSILYNSFVTDAQKTTTQDAIDLLVKDLGVISFDIQYASPTITFVEADTFFQFNSKLTTVSENTTKANVGTAIRNYFENTILFDLATNSGKFKRSFRRSNMLTNIDAVSAAVLSSRSDIRMQQRLNVASPGLSTDSLAVDTITLSSPLTYVLSYPNEIATPDDEFYRISSTVFTYNGELCRLQNRLSSNVLQIVRNIDRSVVIDNIGSYNASAGKLTLEGFSPSAITGTYLKIAAVPANQSVVSPIRNNIIGYDESRSSIRVVNTTSQT